MPKRSRTSDAAASNSAHRLDRGDGAPNRDGSSLSGRGRAEGSAKLRYKSSSARAPPVKRARTTALPLLSLEGSLSEEILLRCLSFLGAHDLVTVARVSSAWHRLAQDPQLWRSLYLRTYASTSVRRRAQNGESVAWTRPWRELYKISTNWRSGSARTSTLGRGLRTAVLPEAPHDLALRTGDAPDPPPAAAATGQPPPVAAAMTTTEDAHTLLQFHHQFIFSATRAPAANNEPPSVTVHQTLPRGDSAVVGCVNSARLHAFFAARPDFCPPLSITEMRVDETPVHSGDGPLLAVFYSTGQFALFRLTLPLATAHSRPFSVREVYVSLALGSPPAYPFSAVSATPFDAVALARLHSPLLVTLSREMTLRFWRLAESEDGGSDGERGLELEEAETPLQTREAWSPVVLSLAQEPQKRRRDERRGGKATLVDDDQRFTVSLAYSAPIFPANWTVGLQEFAVTVPPPSLLSSLIRTPKLRITARHATALPAHAPIPHTPRRVAPLSSSPSAPPPTPANPVTSIEHAHPFIVTSRADNTLDVYEVLSAPAIPRTAVPPRSARLTLDTRTPPPAPLRVVHRQTLFGHTARVASVALRPALGATAAGGSSAAMRCISAGDDGAVKVWSLVPGSTAGRRAREERAVDVHVALTEEEGTDGETAWQRMKRRRGAGVRGRAPEDLGPVRADEAPQRVRRVWVEEDKIVVAERARDGGAETVRVLRFD